MMAIARIADILGKMFESTFKVLKTIDLAHEKIHDGEHFYIKSYVELDDEDELIFAITTTDEQPVAHLLFEIAGTKVTILELYEAAEVTGGTPVVPLNNNRNSANTSTLTIVSGPTITTPGNLISAAKFGLDLNPTRQAGGTTRRDDELNLKLDTTYVVKLISGTDGNTADYRATWYETTSE